MKIGPGLWAFCLLDVATRCDCLRLSSSEVQGIEVISLVGRMKDLVNRG